jgi:hypothetical protein
MANTITTWSRPAWSTPVVAVERTEDQKTGQISVTHVSQQSCPSACPLLNDGCYAETAGMQPFTTRRLNSSMIVRADTIARLEAAAVDSLSGRRQLRGHVVGDCRTVTAAGIVGASYVRHSAKHGQRHWTYTHSWPTVPLTAWRGAHVVASIHTAQEARQARTQGYQVLALATDTRHPTHTPYRDRQTRLKVLPCPAQFAPASGSAPVTCDRCNICQDTTVLKRAGCDAVAFQPDALRKQARS